MQRLQGKTIVITGGNSGIGLASAKQFIAEGAQVAIFGRNRESLDAAQAELGEGALAIQGDVTDQAALAKLFQETEAKLGKIDGVFANAGIAQPRPMAEVDDDFFDATLGINVKGAFFTVQKALPHLAEKASVVLTSSVVNDMGMAGMSVYSASKAAVTSLARTLSAELWDQGVRVNTLAPGPIETPIFGKMGVPEEAVGEMAGSILSSVPMGRFGAPEEVAKAAAFLISDDSSYVMGEEIKVDGGMSRI